MSRWFRHYAGMMRDDKLVRIAIRSKQPIERVVWVWGAILESAAEIDDDGRYDFDADEAAYFLRADVSDLAAILAALTDANHVVENRVVKWGDRQFKSDRSATRVAAHRDRKRAQMVRGDASEESCDDTVTLHNGFSNAPETETETELEEEDSVSNDTDGQKPDEALHPEHVVDEWNGIADRIGKPKVRDITPERRAMLRARIAQYSIDDFVSVFGKVERSPFLRGESSTWRGCTFDWIIKKANFQKVLEGNYDH